MTKAELVKTEKDIHEAIRAISNAWYELGICTGHEIAARLLRAEAGQLYAEGKNDNQAKLYREIADKLDDLYKTGRKAYDAGSSQLKETAYEDVQNLVNILITSVPCDDCDNN